MYIVAFLLGCFLVLLAAGFISIIAAICFVNNKLIAIALIFFAAGIFTFFVLKDAIDNEWE